MGESPGSNIYIVKSVTGRQVLDTLPRYKFYDGNDLKEKRSLVSGWNFIVALELFEAGEGRENAGDVDLNTSEPAFEYDSDDEEYKLKPWFANGQYDSVGDIVDNKTFYYRSDAYLNKYEYPSLENSTGYSHFRYGFTDAGMEGEDYIEVEDYYWTLDKTKTGMDIEDGKIRKVVVLKGSHKYLRHESDINVMLEKGSE